MRYNIEDSKYSYDNADRIKFSTPRFLAHDYLKLKDLTVGHIALDGQIYKVTRGCIKSFMDAHGNRITDDNIHGLIKRILGGLGTTLHNEKEKKLPYKNGGGPMLIEYTDDYINIRQFRC